MEQEPTIKERIELFIQRLLDNGFVEQDEDEVQQYIMFFIGTPLDTRIFKKDIITICISESSQEAEIYMEERFNKTGVGAEPNEFDLWVNTGMYRDPMQLANHEMNHYTDYIISRNANTTINNNMLKQLENSLKQTDATSYYRKGTEQKAYMNQLRTMLKQNADVQNLDEPVSSTLLKKYLDKMSDSDPIKKMFKQHKNINAYTKWFNTIPLLGTTALGANAYFNNNKDE